MSYIETIKQLEDLYGAPGETSTVKVTQRITKEYRAYIKVSPFLALATCGVDGLDCSPRGEKGGVVRVVDESTIHLPDRRGNNRIDSLRNIIADPRVALLFFFPGHGNTIRVNGRARVSVHPELLKSHAADSKLPRTVIVVSVEEVYFQCARAFVRSDLWNSSNYMDTGSLPSPGEILEKLSHKNIDGEAYEGEWPDRARTTLW